MVNDHIQLFGITRKMDNKQIKKAIEYLDPHWEEIMKDYKARAEELNDLLTKDHNQIGLILKTHLIIEHYLTSNLQRNFGLDDIDSVRLSFSQKIKLIPKKDVGATWLKPGITELNRVRNKYAHNLSAELKFDDLIKIKKIVEMSRDISHKSTETLLNDFAKVCGAFLGESDPKIVKLFGEAYKK